MIAECLCFVSEVHLNRLKFKHISNLLHQINQSTNKTNSAAHHRSMSQRVPLWGSCLANAAEVEWIQPPQCLWRAHQGEWDQVCAGYRVGFGLSTATCWTKQVEQDQHTGCVPIQGLCIGESTLQTCTTLDLKCALPLGAVQHPAMLVLLLLLHFLR